MDAARTLVFGFAVILFYTLELTMLELVQRQTRRRLATVVVSWEII